MRVVREGMNDAGGMQQRPWVAGKGGLTGRSKEKEKEKEGDRRGRIWLLL